MVRSHTDDNKGTEPPRLTPKVWTVGSIPVTDKDFLDWCGHQTKKRTAFSMMKLYVQQLNIEAIMLHERQQKEQKEQSHLAETAEAVLSSEPAESLTTSTTEDTPMNIPIPNLQNISSPASQNISNPNPQNSPAVGWIPAPLNLEPPLRSVPLNHL
jgi:hypothetical protein